MRRVAALGILASLCAAIAACGSESSEPQAVETEVPEDLANAATPPNVELEEGATPMAERVATLGLLNKRNNISQDLEMKPGESRRVGDIIVRLSACERRPPWEMQQETGAFVQVLVEGKGDDEGDWTKIFSGWLFKQSPSLNVVEHPVYDVWVKDCAMRYPGEAALPARAATPEAEAAEEASETSAE